MSSPAGSLREQLTSIYVDRGVLNADVVLQEATAAEHPLHHRFNWDDTEAAHQHRLSQASALIRSVRVTYAERKDGSPKDLRAFIAVREPESPRAYYAPVAEVASDPLMAKIVLRQMQREWLTFKRRYEHMAEFTDMVQSSLSEQAG